MANTMALRIAGFGPRMMGSDRHAPGILSLACSLIETRLLVGVQLTNVNFCLRQAESLTETLLKSKADYVVLESALVDASQLIGRTDVPPPRSMRFPSRLHFDQSSKLWDRLMGEFFAPIEYFAEIDPLAPMLDHLAAMALVANASNAAGVSAVVFSPPTRDFRRSARSVVAFKKALRDLAKVQNILLVDCDDALPESQQHQSSYLSRRDQQAVGGAIADTIVTDVLTRPRRFAALIPQSNKVENSQLALRHGA